MGEVNLPNLSITRFFSLNRLTFLSRSQGFIIVSPVLAQTRNFEGNEVNQGVATLEGLEAIFYNLVAVTTTLAGLALFGMLILGGFKYMTAGGDPKASQQARNTITYALFGITLIVAAYLFIRVIQEFTGVNITVFRVRR